MRVFCLLLPVLFLASCVVHDKFPFICFRSGCVAQGYNIKGFKKRLKGQVAVSARKRNAARSKKENEKYARSSSKDQTTDDREEPQPSYASKVIYTKYILSFFIEIDSAQFKDSIIIFHTSEYHDITDADKPRLEHFIKKLPASNVKRVEVREVETGELRAEHHVVISREKKIKRFLHGQNIIGPVIFQRLGDN